MRNKIKNVVIISLVAFVLVAIVFSRSIVNISKRLYSIFKENDIVYQPLSKEIEEAIESYPFLKEIVAKADVNIPIEKGMIPQGIAITENDFIFITAYNYKEKTNSKCYVLNRLGELVNTVTLDIISHVGGIAYDQGNDLFWIPDDDGSLYAYNSSEFLTEEKVNSQVKFEKIGQALKEKNEKMSFFIDYLAIEGSNLYIGSFSKEKNGTIEEYGIKRDQGEIKLLLKKKFKVPNRIQGITFYYFGLERYMILSRSYGRKNDSQILVYKYRENIKNYTENDASFSFDLPPLLEQITVKNKGLYAIFESSSEKYSNCPIIISNILLIDIKKIIA